jgi:hypothetical protein
MRLTEDVARTKQIGMYVRRIFVGMAEEKDEQEEPNVGARIILK